jgi:dihydroorotate dehydrogenase electron transfer subunit
VGGGYAVPTFYFLSKVLKENGTEVTLINGARTKDEHLFSKKFNGLGIKVINTTDDGSFGEKGTSVDVAKRMLNNQRENGKMFDFVYASGPEMMMKALQPLLDNVEYEFLLERYMKCAIGICGNCTMDPLGIRLCVEGPVLPKKLVEQLTEFGKYHRDASGKRIKY